MNLANRLSIFRILLTPLFVGLLIYASPENIFLLRLALAVFLVASLTDALDGYVARRFNQETTLGSYVDPIADKALILSGFLCLSFLPQVPPSMHIPAWVTIAVVSRDAIILSGSAIVFAATGTLKPKPLWVGKITTVFQMLTVLFALFTAPVELLRILFWITTALTLFSGIEYVRRGARLFKDT